MMTSRPQASFVLATLGILACSFWFLASRGDTAPPSTTPPAGLRDHTPHIVALVNARVQVSPDKVLERGTIVMRDGLITHVGEKVAIPADALQIDTSGKTIYAGFIDAYSDIDLEEAKMQVTGPGYWNQQHVAPQFKAVQHWKADKERFTALRSQGITTRMVAPRGDVINGACALVTTGDESAARAVLSENVGLHMRLTVKRGQARDAYPTSPMGAVALARQALHDAAWYRDAWKAHLANKEVPRPERNDALAALQSTIAGDAMVFADAPNEWYLLRADRFAREFGLKMAIVGSGREYRRLHDVVATGRTIIVPVDFPQPPNVASAEAALNISLASLMHWDHAPENPARLANAGVPIAFTAAGLKDKADFLARVRTAVERGLSKQAALAALTTTPAKLFDIHDRLGTIEPGKLANVVVASGDLFDKQTKIEQVWIDSRRYDITTPPAMDFRGTWDLTLVRPDESQIAAELAITGDADKLKGKLRVRSGGAAKAVEIPLVHMGQREFRFSAAFNAEKLGLVGIARLSALAHITSDQAAHWHAQVTWADGQRTELTALRTKKFEPDTTDNDKKKEDDAGLKQPIDRKATFPLTYPLGAWGVEKTPERPHRVLFTHATIWTSSAAGVLEDASLLIEDGKIVQAAREIATPDGAVVIDLKGQHLSPGIIDCHSHMATDGGINETGQAITAEVRVGDFIDPDDVNIYRQLAGGVTTINILHGSANPIGGQNQVCKLRHGGLDEAMKFAAAPPGIKFALGENVKQSNWGERFTSRYPQSRMGVEQIMRDEFAAARQYEQDWNRWNKEHAGLPPRKDLELDIVLEILRGERWVHCHCYRQDEILTFLKVTDDYGFRVGTLQHILEGYKVADAMAARGVMGSAFSDWWAYKMEVYDAIPHNGAVMRNAGVVVSFNSDDLELARHLNHEAAKAMKYGQVPAVDALNFVTINPAKQLRIDAHVGSLEPGKDADLAIWSGPPLSSTARCEQTWVDGRRYFDRADDAARRTRDRARHAALVQKILASGDAMLSPDELDGSEPDVWPRTDVFCGHNHEDGYRHE